MALYSNIPTERTECDSKGPEYLLYKQKLFNFCEQKEKKAVSRNP